MENVKDVLNKLNITDPGKYDNHFYVINLADSNAYAKMYTNLCNHAENTEDPAFKINTSNTTTGITNYFTVDCNNCTYNVFLIADFDKNAYYVKIDELGD